MGESRIDIPQTPQETEKAEDESAKGTQSISSSIRQTPEVTEKTEDEGGKTIYSSMLKSGKAIFSMLKSIVNRPGSSQPHEKANDPVGIPPQSNNVPQMFPPGSSQPPEKENDQVGIPPQSNNVVPQMFPPGLIHLLPHGSENIESELLPLDRECNFDELVKTMIGDTLKIRKWYVGAKRHLSESNTELRRMMDRYNDEELGRMMARSGLLLLEFLRFLADIPRSNEFFRPRDRQLSVQEAVIKIDNRIPIFVLKKILEWERDADKDENRLGSDGDADTDLHSILKEAWLKLSPNLYDSQARVPLKDGSHLLEFVYENIIRSSDIKHAYKWRNKWRNNEQGGHDITLPRAVQLKDKGVKFARNKGLLKTIRFDRRNLTLYLPAIKMDGGTDALLRNLVRFEASKQEKRPQPLMSYVDLMDRLIDTQADVQALTDGGIIQNHLGSNNDVANVWNGMRRELPAEIIKYKPINNAMDDVICFYTSRHRILCTEFKLRYCSKPWIVLSVISACILFGLTAFQTYLAWEQVRLQRESMPKT